jgi:TPR repeat protein
MTFSLKTGSVLWVLWGLTLTTPVYGQSYTFPDDNQETIGGLQSLPRISPLKKPHPLYPTPDPFVQLYLKQAKKGDIKAQTILGNYYLNGNNPLYNPSTAFKWFYPAAQKGDKTAQFNIGILYQQGLGTTKSDQKALKWFLKVVEESGAEKTEDFADNMLSWVYLKLGIIYYKGEGTAINYPLALSWFKKLLEDNHPYGQFFTGLMYAQGLGVVQDEKRGVFWLKAAAGQGLKSAKEALKGPTHYNLIRNGI